MPFNFELFADFNWRFFIKKKKSKPNFWLLLDEKLEAVETPDPDSYSSAVSCRCVAAVSSSACSPFRLGRTSPVHHCPSLSAVTPLDLSHPSALMLTSDALCTIRCRSSIMSSSCMVQMPVGRREAFSHFEDLYKLNSESGQVSLFYFLFYVFIPPLLGEGRGEKKNYTF